MIISVSCPKCNFKITPEMSFTLENKKCPSCGTDIDLGQTPTIFLFLATAAELTLDQKLTPQELKGFATTFFGKIGFKFPEVHIEEDPNVSMLREAKKALQHIPPPKVASVQQQQPVEDDMTVDQVLANVQSKQGPRKQTDGQQDEPHTTGGPKKPAFVKVSDAEVTGMQAFVAGNQINNAVASSPKSDNIANFLASATTGNGDVGLFDPADTVRSIAMMDPMAAAQMTKALKPINGSPGTPIASTPAVAPQQNFHI